MSGTGKWPPEWLDSKIGELKFSEKLSHAMKMVEEECLAAVREHGELVSLHEFLGVMTEEFEEVKEIIFLKAKDRDRDALFDELIQCAAVSIRAAILVKTDPNFR